MKIKKICLYSPYVPKHTGGGEKYFFDVATFLARLPNYEVYIAVSSIDELSETQAHEYQKKYETYLGRSLGNIKFIDTPLGTSVDFKIKFNWTRRFDLLYYVTDGSFFITGAKRNIMHIQIPFTNKLQLKDRLKLLSWQVINTNSEFTKNVIEKSWGVKVNEVHYPMIQSRGLTPTQKELSRKQNVILHVGRFFKQLHCKKQEILVEVFRDLRKKYPELMKNWQLVFIGNIEDQDYADKLHNLASGLPIAFEHHLSNSELHNYYEQAKIYWHATGFGEDENEHPEKMEHFGISTVEAMAAGCVPIVINKGGQKEVVGEQLKSLLWDNQEECIKKTINLIQNPRDFIEFQLLAIKQATVFNEERFNNTLLRMIE